MIVLNNSNSSSSSSSNRNDIMTQSKLIAPYSAPSSSRGVQSHKPNKASLKYAKQEETYSHMSIYEDWPLSGIKDPHPENDVLFGRGGKTNHHVGNIRYRSWVDDKYRPLYEKCRTKTEKTLLAMKLIKDWRLNQTHGPPGRFLTFNYTSGTWEDVGDRRAREKISQALRESISLHLKGGRPGHKIGLPGSGSKQAVVQEEQRRRRKANESSSLPIHHRDDRHIASPGSEASYNNEDDDASTNHDSMQRTKKRPAPQDCTASQELLASQKNKRNPKKEMLQRANNLFLLSTVAAVTENCDNDDDDTTDHVHDVPSQAPPVVTERPIMPEGRIDTPVGSSTSAPIARQQLWESRRNGAMTDNYIVSPSTSMDHHHHHHFASRRQEARTLSPSLEETLLRRYLNELTTTAAPAAAAPRRIPSAHVTPDIDPGLLYLLNVLQHNNNNAPPPPAAATIRNHNHLFEVPSVVAAAAPQPPIRSSMYENVMASHRGTSPFFTSQLPNSSSSNSAWRNSTTIEQNINGLSSTERDILINELLLRREQEQLLLQRNSSPSNVVSTAGNRESYPFGLWSSAAFGRR